MSTAEKMAYSAMKAKMQVQPPEERPYNPGKPTAAEEAAKGFEMGRYQQGSKGMTTSPGKKPGQESQAEEKARGMAPGKF